MLFTVDVELDSQALLQILAGLLMLAKVREKSTQVVVASGDISMLLAVDV